MAVSDRSRKLLWGRGASRCSICRRDLVVDADLGEGDALVGEECHIVAQSSGGPRADPGFPVEHLDSYVNLILLCRNHHKEVDDLPESYSVARLNTLKRDHEHWVRTRLGVDGGAFPARSSDVLLSRFPLPVVFGYLVDNCLSAAKGVVAGDTTFDASRRALKLAERLKRRLSGLVPLLTTDNHEQGRALSEFIDHALGWFLGEARVLLPSEDEVVLTKPREMYNDAWEFADARWAAVRDVLLSDPILVNEYHELAESAERWPLLGFASGEEFREWLEPTTKTLFDSPGRFELEFLSQLAREGKADIEELVRKGMPRRICIEVFNRLARDNWAYHENGIVRMTPLSRSFLEKELTMQASRE